MTFVDNVATLGIENCLLDPLQRILSSQVINNMHDDQVRELASEPSFTSDERDRLASEVEKLQAGLRTLKTFNIQKPSLSGPPSIEKLEKPRIGFQDIRPPVTGAKSTTQSSLFPGPQEVKTLKSQTTKPFHGEQTASVFNFTSKSSYYQLGPRSFV